VNLGVVLDTVADVCGSRVGFGSLDGGTSYDRLRTLSAGAGAVLTSSGAAAVCYAVPAGLAFPVTLFGAAWAGRPFAPVNYRLPARAQDRLIERLGGALVVGNRAIAAGSQRPRPVLAVDAWLTAAGRATPADLSYVEDPDTPAVVLFTSGTSAEPKLARLGHENLLSYTWETADLGAAGEDEAALLATPPFHIAGVAAVISNCWAGRRLVPLPAFSAEAWLTTVAAERVTHAFVVPTMLARIVAAWDAGEAEPPRGLRSLSYGGARMPQPVLEAALRHLPDTGFVNAYGLTETSSTIALLGPEDHRAALAGDAASRRRLGSVGRPLPGIRMSIVDDRDRPVPAGTTGRILVRGDQVFSGYAGGSTHGAGDWLDTGDVGWLDPDGYLFLAGRADDLIISGGENISPGEIEDALLRHPEVTGAAVVGVPDPDWGEVVAAMVTLRPGAEVEPETLTAWAAERLGRLKSPKLVALADELPVTPSGKILRRSVRDALTRRPA
jgi:fatty-acyl-CoA synthase